MYFGLTVLVELGVLRALGYQLRRLWRALRQGAAATCLRVSTAMDRQPSPGQYARLANGEGEAAEDEDVQQERLRLQDAGAVRCFACFAISHNSLTAFIRSEHLPPHSPSGLVQACDISVPC